MEPYIAVLGRNIQMEKTLNNGLKCYNTVLVSRDGKDFTSPSVLDEVSLAVNVLKMHRTPINFSVEQGKIKENQGAFSRFSKARFVAVVKIVDNLRGRTLGYRLYDRTNVTVYDVKTSQVAGLDIGAVQNLIVKNKSVSEYPDAHFPTMVIELKRAPKRIKRTIEYKNEPKAEPKVEPKPKAEPKKPKEQGTSFTQAQLNQLDKASKYLSDISFIKNPKLTPKQMNSLWVGAANGAYSYAYNNPIYPVETIRCYNEFVKSKDDAVKYSPILKHPKFTQEKITALKFAIDNGYYEQGMLRKNPDEILEACMNKQYTDAFDKLTKTQLKVLNDELHNDALRALTRLKLMR